MNGNVGEAGGWIFDGRTAAPSVCLSSSETSVITKDWKLMLLSSVFFFPNLVLRPKNWHPIRARKLTCVRWELFNYFGELQHDMKSVFWVTELRLDYASMWWAAVVSSALFQLSFHTRSCDLSFWLKCCLRLVLFLGGELPSCRKKC